MANRFEEFRAAHAVVKDVTAIRAKGIMVEEVLEFVEQKFPTVAATYYSAVFSAGIPSAYIGVASQEDWERIRGALRAKRLVR